MEIQSQILKQEPVQWKSLKWLQSSKLKDIGDRGIEKLKNSLKENNFVQPFNVWQDSKGTIWILDGHHREKALTQLEQEGYKIPETLPANFIDCKDKKDAAKMVLLYSSIYAKITNDGLGEFLDDFDLDLSNLVNEIDLPGLDFDPIFEPETLPEDIDESPQPLEKTYSILGDVFEIDGKHRVMCGDSTKESDVSILMNGQKADITFTSPPYNGGSLETGDGDIFKKNSKKKLYANGYQDNLESSEYLNFVNSVLKNCFDFTEGFIFWNVNYNANSRFEYIQQITPYIENLIEQICWKKTSAIPLKGCMRRAWEPIYLFSTSGQGLSLKNVESNFWEISNTNTQTEDHKACFPVALCIKGIELLSKCNILFDPFLGSGSTLIAAETTKRICYGMEIDQHYCDVILRRYKKTFPNASFKCLTRPDFPFEELFNA